MPTFIFVDDKWALIGNNWTETSVDLYERRKQSQMFKDFMANS